MRVSLLILLIEENENDKKRLEFDVLTTVANGTYDLKLEWHRTIKSAWHWLKNSPLRPDFIFLDPAGTGVGNIGNALEHLSRYCDRQNIMAITGESDKSQLYARLRGHMGNNTFQKNQTDALIEALREGLVRKTSSGGLTREFLQLESNLQSLSRVVDLLEDRIEATGADLLKLNITVLQGSPDGQHLSIAQTAHEAYRQVMRMKVGLQEMHKQIQSLKVEHEAQAKEQKALKEALDKAEHFRRVVNTVGATFDFLRGNWRVITGGSGGVAIAWLIYEVVTKR